MPDNRIIWTPRSSNEFSVTSMPFVDRNEMSLDLCNRGDEEHPAESVYSNLTVEAATQLRDLLNENLAALKANDDYEDWKAEVANGDTRRGYEDWRNVNRMGLD